jgi:hypothetical protein
MSTDLASDASYPKNVGISAYANLTTHDGHSTNLHLEQLSPSSLIQSVHC